MQYNRDTFSRRCATPANAHRALPYRKFIPHCMVKQKGWAQPIMSSAATLHTVLSPMLTSTPPSTTWSSYAVLFALRHRNRLRHSRLWRPDLDRTFIPSTVTSWVTVKCTGRRCRTGGKRSETYVPLGAVPYAAQLTTTCFMFIY